MARARLGPANSRKRPQPVAHVNKSENLPHGPGEYFWDHWKSLVTVVKRGNSLYVTPPCKGAVEIKISQRTVGKFVAAPPKETDGS